MDEREAEERVDEKRKKEGIKLKVASQPELLLPSIPLARNKFESGRKLLQQNSTSIDTRNSTGKKCQNLRGKKYRSSTGKSTKD